MPAKEQEQGGKQAEACPPAHRQAALGLLPPQPMAEVFASLCASDAGRAAVVCKAWHAAATGEAVAWDLAITELDPFCTLAGGSEGAWHLFRSVGQSWLRAAAALTGCSPWCSEAALT